LSCKIKFREAITFMKRRGQNRKSGHGKENTLIGKIDADAFRDYHAKILRSIREDLMNGLSADQIFKKYEAHAAAALVSQMTDPKNAVQAAEKVLDRTQGKAIARTENTHKLEKLSEKELDSFLTSQLNELNSDDDEKPVQ
jgi:flagellar biosynthesis chaperone FliJ